MTYQSAWPVQGAASIGRVGNGVRLVGAHTLRHQIESRFRVQVQNSGSEYMFKFRFHVQQFLIISNSKRKEHHEMF
jgi:hypothetical protein